jgi:hypothetical protein
MVAETGPAISNLIQSTMKEFDLEPRKLVSLCADNTTTNFGGLHRRGEGNVFALLKNGLIMKILIKK